MLPTILSALGALVLARFALWIGSVIYYTFLLPSANLGKKYGQGSWVVITGASDGLGKVFAKELARQGLNLVLVSRTESKLKDVAAEITAKYSSISCKVVAMDMSTATKASLESKIGGAVKGLDVSMLVNNVGVNVAYPTMFHEMDDDMVTSIINVNISVTTHLTKLLLPGMIARKGKSGILNLSSSSGTTPTAMLSVYGATKAFIDNFSQTLAVEYAPQGIEVLCFAPAFLHTPMTNKRKPDLLTPLPIVAVRPALSKLGYQYKTNPYWLHAIIDMIATFPLTREMYMRYLLPYHQDIRKRAIRKRERMAAEAAKKD